MRAIARSTVESRCLMTAVRNSMQLPLAPDWRVMCYTCVTNVQPNVGTHAGRSASPPEHQPPPDCLYPVRKGRRRL